MGRTIGVLSNPNSGKNRRKHGRRLELERAAGRHGIVRETKDVGGIAAALRDFIDAGCEYWVCDGGDGTLHWILGEAEAVLREQGLHDLPRIVPANGGSIDFVAHKAGIRGEAAQVVRALVDHIARGQRPITIALDTMRLRGRAAGPFDRLGFAAALGGVAQRFFGKLYERRPVDAWTIAEVLGKSALSGMAVTMPTPLRSLVPRDLLGFAEDIFTPTRARIDVDGVPLAADSFLTLQVGSIDINLGGVVRTFRQAAAAGVLHAQAVSTTPLGIVVNLPNIVLGTPIWGRQVFDGPVQRLRMEAMAGEAFEPVIDGEMYAGLSVLEVTHGPQMRVPSVCRA